MALGKSTGYPADSPAVGLGRRGLRLLQGRLQYLFVLPAAIFLGGLLGYPLAANLWLSFTNRHMIRPSVRFIGLENYLAVLADGEFWLSLTNSLYWVGGAVCLQLAIGMGSALLLNQRRPGTAIFRTLLLVPWIFPGIVLVIIWKWLLNDLNGLINYLLLTSGLVSTPIGFLASPATAMPTLIAVEVWRGFPFMMLALLAGLQTISADLYEAAKIDGAGALARFRYVTLPSLAPVIAVVLVLRTIWVFNSFEIVFLMTGGGPGRATQTLPLFAYNTGWIRLQLGQAAAVFVLMSLVLALAVFIYFRLFGMDRGIER